METEVVIPIVFFVFLGTVIVVPTWLRERTRQAGYKLIVEAAQSGNPLESAVVRRLAKANPDRARHMLGAGVLLLALAAAALVNRSLISRAYEDGGAGMLLGAVTFAALGVGFLFLSAFDYTNDRRE